MSKRKPWRMEVRWRDSHISTAPGWRTARDYTRRSFRNSPMVSVGFVLADDKTGMVLAGSIDFDTGACVGVVAIPAGAIVSRRRLR